MQKKALFIWSSAYYLGGVSVWLEYIYKGLQEKGWQVTLGLTSGEYHNVEQYRNFYPSIKNVITFDNPTGSRQGRINNLARQINAGDFDLVVVNNIPDSYDAINGLRKQGYEGKVVCALHGIQADLFEDIEHHKNIIDAVVCSNKLTMALAHEIANIDKERLHYAPYGVDFNNAQTKTLKTRKPLIIAWVGRIEEFQKRVLSLANIVAQLAQNKIDFKLLIAGEGEERQYLESLLEKDDTLHYVQFMGVVDTDDMNQSVYQQCDALLVTSYWETGPIIIWEAMAQGKPVVSTRYIGSGLENSLVDGDNCLSFDVGDISMCVNQLIKLQDQTTYASLVSGGWRLLKERYNKHNSIEHWHQALKSIAEQPALSYHPAPKLPAAGRLDRIFGSRLAERIRSWCGIRFRHTSAGGEWPHSYGITPIDDKEFWSYAKHIDQANEARD